MRCTLPLTCEGYAPHDVCHSDGIERFHVPDQFAIPKALHPQRLSVHVVEAIYIHLALDKFFFLTKLSVNIALHACAEHTAALSPELRSEHCALRHSSVILSPY